jgi:hypothetical protein
MTSEVTYTLSILDSAMESCFGLADTLAERYGLPFVEYGFLGLSSDDAPLRVVYAMLLPGQTVSDQSVYVPGRHVFGSLRSEVDSLSQRVGQRLVPIAFIHRHPTVDISLSEIDREFLMHSFLNQVAAVVTFREDLPLDVATDGPCRPGTTSSQGSVTPRLSDPVLTEYAVAFSLIVHRRRGLAAHAARKIWCPRCGRPQTHMVPAAVHIECTEGPGAPGDSWPMAL